MQLKTQMSLVSDMGLNTLKDCMNDWRVAGWVQDTALVLLDCHMVAPCEEDDRPVVTIVT